MFRDDWVHQLYKDLTLTVLTNNECLDSFQTKNLTELQLSADWKNPKWQRYFIFLFYNMN